jgi:hypothetical protein
VDVEEGELKFDPVTRHLTYVAGSPKAAGAADVIFDVLRTVSEATDPMSIRNVQAALKGHHSKGEIEAALKQATNRGDLTLVIGRKGTCTASRPPVASPSSGSHPILARSYGSDAIESNEEIERGLAAIRGG